MTISSWETVESTSLLRRNDSAAPYRRPQRRHLSSGRAVEPVLAKRAESKSQAPAIQITLVVRRAHREFRCEGHLGDWDGHCGYCILSGEGYVQSGDRRLCLACAEIEAKQVANAERAFARALFESFKEALAEPLGNSWNVGISAWPSDWPIAPLPH
jgi:hypothetical protein